MHFLRMLEKVPVGWKSIVLRVLQPKELKMILIGDQSISLKRIHSSQLIAKLIENDPHFASLTIETEAQQQDSLRNAIGCIL